ncbi:MAG: hypothetical protein M0011_10405 [Elusimicrobia bacterium]|nr:hypothetical protein [Elusimicrobiota bacterium]
MRKALLFLLLAAPASAQNLPDLPDLGDLPEPTRYLAGYINAGIGKNIPIGGHWGDKTAGFSSSSSFSLSVSKRVDEVLSYGAETFYAGAHKNKASSGLQLRIIALAPFVRASYSEGRRVFYGILGAGVYQWRQPGYTSGGLRFGADSGSSIGLNLGGGVAYPFLFGTMGGLELRWHHIFSVKGASLDLGSADSLNLAFSLQYGVWRDKKSPVPTP